MKKIKRNCIASAARRDRKRNKPEQRIPSLHDSAFCEGARRGVLGIINGQPQYFRKKAMRIRILPTLPKVSPWREVPWYHL